MTKTKSQRRILIESYRLILAAAVGAKETTSRPENRACSLQLRMLHTGSVLIRVCRVHPVSGFVVSYNRDTIIETCLRSIRFVDELIVFDKSSTDRTKNIASRYADQVISVPWSPTVEETRAAALAVCRYDRIIFLDDDECFSPEAIEYLNRELRVGDYDLYSLPCRHHVLGRHDESAYYWPDRHIRAFRRGYLDFKGTVHSGMTMSTEAKTAYPDLDSGICFHNISHVDTRMWIEKTNRYTSQKDRVGSVQSNVVDLFEEARRSLESWSSKCSPGASNYVQAVALLRAVYDMVDIVKQWEQREGEDGNALFAKTCDELVRRYDELQAKVGIATSRSG